MSFKLDFMCEIVLGSDLRTGHAAQGKWNIHPCAAPNQRGLTIAAFLMASPVTTPAKPALLITYKEPRFPVCSL